MKKGFLLIGFNGESVMITDQHVSDFINFYHTTTKMPRILRLIINYESLDIKLVYLDNADVYDKVKLLQECDQDINLVSEIFESLKQECDEQSTRRKIISIKEALERV